RKAIVMSGTVMLSIFSGLPNPEWPLPTDVAEGFRQHIQDYPASPVAQPAFLADATDVLMRPPAGFRGFTLTVEASAVAPPATYPMYGGLILGGMSILYHGDMGFEEKIYNTAPDSVKAQLGNMTYSQLIVSGSESPISGLQGVDPRLDCHSSTVYEGNTGV